MAVKKSELYSSLWASCDALRGGMDASQYKDYILTLLFVKYVSDKFIGEDYADVEVPEGGSFDDMVKLIGKKNIGEGINKVIAKKKAIKQGAMQELLTGKRRLSGYTEKWNKVKLGACCGFLSGGTPAKANNEWWNGTIPWISSSDILANDINRIPISRFISQDALEHSATKLCPVHSVLIVSRVGVGKVAVNCELCTSQDFTTLVPRLHDAYYLAYCLLPIMQEKASQAQGTSIKGITTDDIAEIEVFLPEKDEQKAIASVLLDMDVQRLEQKLLKCRSIRQGMMSELLAGHIRLIDKEAV